MRARLLALLVTASTPALAAPAPAKAAPKPEAIPKALPRDGDGSAKPGDSAKLPPYLGLFGPTALIQKTGFRSSPGRFIEYALDNTTGEAQGATMRIQEVGPVQPGLRWIEVLAVTGGTDTSGMKMLTRGDKDGNIERMIASMPGLPAMEFPMDSASIQPAEGGPPGAPLGPAQAAQLAMGTPKKVGHETVQVPLGKFDCDHWVVEAEDAKMEFWTTSDPKIPFTGAVKIVSADGIAAAAKVGTDAAARIPVPPKAR